MLLATELLKVEPQRATSGFECMKIISVLALTTHAHAQTHTYTCLFSFFFLFFSYRESHFCTLP